MFLFKTWLQIIGRFIRWSTEALPSSRDMVQWQGTRIGRSNQKLKDFHFHLEPCSAVFSFYFLFCCDKTCACLLSLMHDILIRDILSFMCGVWSEKCKRFFYSWPLSCKHARYQRPEIAITAVSLHGQHFNSKKVNCFRLAKSGKTKS